MIHLFFDSIQSFLHRGGWVLYLIFFVTAALWVLIIERVWYFYFDFKKESQQVLEQWQKRADYHSLLSKKIWQADFSILKQKLEKNLSYIKTLVSLCPLMGLLGTVTGMIAVFEVMAELGTGNARLMADGISMATIPTMAGMVGALSGIYISRLLDGRSQREQNKLLLQHTRILRENSPDV